MEKISSFFSWLASVRVWFTNWLCWGAELSFCRSDWPMLACDEDRWFVQSPDNCFSRLLSRWFCETNHVEHQMLILHTLYCNSRKKWLVITIMLLIMFKKKELWHRYLWISELRHQNWIRTKKKKWIVLVYWKYEGTKYSGCSHAWFCEQSYEKILNLRLVFGGHGHEDKVE